MVISCGGLKPLVNLFMNNGQSFKNEFNKITTILVGLQGPKWPLITALFTAQEYLPFHDLEINKGTNPRKLSPIHLVEAFYMMQIFTEIGVTNFLKDHEEKLLMFIYQMLQFLSKHTFAASPILQRNKGFVLKSVALYLAIKIVLFFTGELSLSTNPPPSQLATFSVHMGLSPNFVVNPTWRVNGIAISALSSM